MSTSWLIKKIGDVLAGILAKQVVQFSYGFVIP